MQQQAKIESGVYLEETTMGYVPISRSCSFLGTGRQSSFLLVVGFVFRILSVHADMITREISINMANVNNTAGPLKIRDLCPGVEYLLNNTTTNITMLQGSDAPDCWPNHLPDFTEHHGVVYGVCENSSVYCRVHVEVPQGMFVHAHIQRLAYWCDSRQWRTYIVYLEWPWLCSTHSPAEVFIESSTNHMYFTHINHPAVKINVKAVTDHNFIVVYVSTHFGYLIVPATCFTSDLWGELKAPSIYIIMVSFQCKLHGTKQKCLSIKLYYKQPNTNQLHIEIVHVEYGSPAMVFPTSQLVIRLPLRKYLYEENSIIFFSFHAEYEKPQKLPSGLFNCSADRYSSFQHHLDCNLRDECNDGQDETEHCPFSSFSCQGLVSSRNKCFKHVMTNTRFYRHTPEYQCLTMGGRLASVETRKEQEDFLQMFKNFTSFKVHISLVSNSQPAMYTKFRKWSSNTIIYNMNHFVLQFTYVPSRTTSYGILHDMVLKLKSHRHNIWEYDVVCETKYQSENGITVQTVELPDLNPYLSNFTCTQQILFVCSNGHVTHSFLSRNTISHCGKNRPTRSQSCVFFNMSTDKDNTLDLGGISTAHTTVMFKCDDDITIVPYTLVCDFRYDCPDKSDELFCVHPSCDGFLCSSGQCVWNSQQCNEYSDCLDNSDEVSCLQLDSDYFYHKEANKNQQLLINLDGTGYFTQQAMKAAESCPDTHYHCTEDWSYCLPVYTRCNGFSDCTYGEDEQDCETLTCHGFYHCRASSICVHGDHLCDGWGQCPQRDDEWMCGMTCPEDCLCQGHSFLCSKPFSADLFPQLHYMDASNSGMTLTNFSKSAYLIWLSLSHCSLVNIPDVTLPNLQFIDLASNQLRSVNVNMFFKLLNLRNLILKRNPLSTLTSKPFNVFYTLTEIDLSRTHLEVFNHELTMYLPQVNILNLSFSTITAIGSLGFRNTPQLTKLDIRGNPIKNVHCNLLLNLNNLKNILSSNFRLCCETLHPKMSIKIKCIAPQPLLSSCTALLPSELYRAFSWTVCILATLGNMICCWAPCVEKEMFGSTFIIFLVHFQFANICMGIHTSVVTVANEIVRGKYIYFEKTWTDSLACRVAGFLSLLSSEVSVLIMWIMTLDHIIILYFPLNTWRLNQRLTTAVASVMWIVGILLSITPFLPGLSHWGLDGQSGLCRLAIFDYYKIYQKVRWFSVVAVFNFVLCLLAVVGQSIIYRQIPEYKIVTDSIRGSVFSSAHLLVKVAVTNSFCWLSFGLTSFMTLGGVAVSDNLHVAMVVFMLPLSSALNPLLYMWTVITQRRQQEQEKKVLQVLKLRLSLSVKTVMSSKTTD